MIKKLFSKNSPNSRMNFDKTSPKNCNPQQQKISRNPTKKPAQLCGKTVQLATLMAMLPSCLATYWEYK